MQPKKEKRPARRSSENLYNQLISSIIALIDAKVKEALGVTVDYLMRDRAKSSIQIFIRHYAGLLIEVLCLVAIILAFRWPF